MYAGSMSVLRYDGGKKVDTHLTDISLMKNLAATKICHNFFSVLLLIMALNLFL